MAESTAKLREISWSELFPWLMLVRSVRIALLARVLVLGAVGLIATTLGWRLIDSLFSESTDEVIESFRSHASHWVWEETREFAIAMSARSAAEIFLSAGEGLLEAPVALWLYLTRPFIDLFSADIGWEAFFYLVLCMVWELVVWGLIGGAITRIAALKFTRDEAPGLVAAVKYAAGKWASYSLPPLVVLAGASIFAIQLMVLGLLMQLDFFALLAALAWPFVLVLGLLMAILLLGALVGWPLMWATISVEGTDAFDAVSRSYAYTYHRPWRLLWYVLFVGILAVVSMFVVRVFAATSIALGDWSVNWGLDAPTMQNVVRQDVMPVAPAVAPPLDPQADAAAGDGGTTSRPNVDLQEPNPEENSGFLLPAAKRAVYFWKSLLAALAAGYQAGFLWASAVGVYLLLRRDIDGVQMNEVYIDQDEEYGLPPLEPDAATGVPDVSPTAAARPGDITNPDELPRTD
jgi:hypothetical protein